MAGTLPQQPVLTSSPPRWMKLSGKRPLGAPGAEVLPPVHSPSTESMSFHVASEATLSGVVHVGEGHTSGSVEVGEEEGQGEKREQTGDQHFHQKTEGTGELTAGAPRLRVARHVELHHHAHTAHSGVLDDGGNVRLGVSLMVAKSVLRGRRSESMRATWPIQRRHRSSR